MYGLGTLITGVPGVLSRRIDPRTSTVMVWGAVNAGVAANAIPQTGMLAGTVRTANRDTWADPGIDCRETLRRCSRRWASSTRLQLQRGVPPVVNEEISTRIVTHAIEAIGTDVLGRHPSVRRRRGLLLVSRGGARRDGAAGRVDRAVARSSICTSRRSTSTSGRWRWAFARWSTSSTRPPPSIGSFAPRATVFVRDTPRRPSFGGRVAGRHSAAFIQGDVILPTAALAAVTISRRGIKLEPLDDRVERPAARFWLHTRRSKLALKPVPGMGRGINCRGEPTICATWARSVVRLHSRGSRHRRRDARRHRKPADLTCSARGCRLRSAEGLVCRRDHAPLVRGCRRRPLTCMDGGSRARPRRPRRSRSGRRVAQRA